MCEDLCGLKGLSWILLRSIPREFCNIFWMLQKWQVFLLVWWYWKPSMVLMPKTWNCLFKCWRIKCQNANAPLRMPMSDPQCEGMLATYGLLSCAPGKAKCVGKVECCQFGSNSIIARGQWAAKRWNARAEDNAIVWMANAFFAIYGLASCWRALNA